MVDDDEERKEETREIVLLEAKKWHESGRFEYEQARYDAALRCFRSALMVYREHGYRRGEGEVLGSIGNLHRARGDLSSAVECHRSAIEIFRSLGYRRAEGNQLGNLGNVFRARGRLALAIEHYERAIEIARALGNDRSEGIFLGNLGMTHGIRGDHESSVDCHLRALELHRGVGDKRFEGIHLGNLGDALAALGRWEEAETAFREAIPLNDRTFPVAAGAFRAGLALVLARGDRFEEAQRLLEIGQPLVVSNPEEHGRFLCKAARIHVLSGDMERGRSAFQQARALATSANIGEHSELGVALAALGDLRFDGCDSTD